MSSYVLTDAKIWAAGYDFSGSMNQGALDYEAETLDNTAFGATTRSNKGGLLTANAAFQGFWDSSVTTAPDPVIFSQIGTSDLPIVIVPQGATVGNTTFLFRALSAKYTPGAQVGDLLRFGLEMKGSGGHPLVRGKLFHAGSAAGDVTGTAIQLGATASGKYLYAALQVFSGSGNFTVKVQSDDNSGFTSATDRITFAQVGTGTAIASEWARVAGPITDDWIRITATNPATRNFAVAIGIF
jgi:hypothetical protein